MYSKALDASWTRKPIIRWYKGLGALAEGCQRLRETLSQAQAEVEIARFKALALEAGGAIIPRLILGNKDAELACEWISPRTTPNEFLAKLVAEEYLVGRLYGYLVDELQVFLEYFSHHKQL